MGAATGTDKDFETNLQKLIPDGLIGRFDLDAPFDSPPNRHDGCETFLEVKTLAALSMTPNARALKFQSDVEKRVHDLDLSILALPSLKGLSLMARTADKCSPHVNIHRNAWWVTCVSLLHIFTLVLKNIPRISREHGPAGNGGVREVTLELIPVVEVTKLLIRRRTNMACEATIIRPPEATNLLVSKAQAHVSLEALSFTFNRLKKRVCEVDNTLSPCVISGLCITHPHNVCQKVPQVLRSCLLVTQVPQFLDAIKK